MSDDAFAFRLTACRELIETHPDSLLIREQVEALENALPDSPGIAVSFCRTIIETTCLPDDHRNDVQDDLDRSGPDA